jgi:hypothetical protein
MIDEIMSTGFFFQALTKNYNLLGKGEHVLRNKIEIIQKVEGIIEKNNNSWIKITNEVYSK